MYRVVLRTRNDVAAWRDAVRPLLAARVTPEDVFWAQADDAGGLFDDGLLPAGREPVSVPRTFVDAAGRALCHSDPQRFDLLYRIAYRLQSDRGLLTAASDRDVVALDKLIKAVRRDSHKMKAFVRFRALDDSNQRFAAWFEPEHYTLERTAPFFAERFAGMRWAIFTPYRSAMWDGAQLVFGPGARKQDVPHEDDREDAWRTYYASIFNPARLKISAMTSEMPRKYWRNLPEAELIGDLIRTARRREGAMLAAAASQPPSRHMRQVERGQGEAETDRGDEVPSLEALARAVQACRNCPLFECATQAVCGAGPQKATLMLVGEQPGDGEDLAGRPFVGPAGQLLDEVLGQVGIERAKAYVTNAVKHFKFLPRGKRRLHQKPDAHEVAACAPWLAREIALVDPTVIVALGATAARSLLGHSAPMSKLRGQLFKRADGRAVFVTYHPSYLLRIPDRQKASEARSAFVADLAAIGKHIETGQQPRTPLDSTPAAP